MSKTVSFFGADHKCGTTMTALCVASRLAAMHPELEILLVSCDNKTGEDYSPKICESMERIRPYINEKLADMHEIAAKARYSNNLSIIGGAGAGEYNGDFNADGIAYFLSCCKDYYDFIICDSGSDVFHSLSIGSMYAADELYLVADQRELSFRNYERYLPLFRRLDIHFTAFILNKYDRENPYSVDYCLKRLCIEKDELLTVKESAFGDIAEMQQKSLLEFKGVAFKRDIDKLCKRICSEDGTV